MIDITNKDKGIIINEFLKYYEEADKNRMPKYVKWSEYETIYNNSTLVQDKRSKRSNIVVPHLFTAIQTILPRILEVIYSGGRLLDVVSRQIKNVKRAEIMSSLIQYMIDLYPSSYMEMHNLILQTLKQGTGFLKVFWNDTDQAVYFKHADLGDVWVDPLAINIEESRYLIHRIETTWTHLLEQQKIGIYKGVTEAKSSWSGDMRSDSLRYARLNVRGIYGTEDIGEGIDKAVLYEMWTSKGIVSIVNKLYIIRVAKNAMGFIPFIRALDYPSEVEFYGKGEIEIGRDIAREINKKRNQRMDCIDLATNPVIMHDSSLIDIGELYNIFPGKIISSKERLNGPIANAVMTWSPQINVADSVREEEMLKLEFQNSLSVNDFMQGQHGPNLNDTAQGISIIADQMTKRFRMKTDLMLYNVILPLGRMILTYCEKFMKPDMIIRISSKNNDDEFVAIDSDLLKDSDQFDLKVVGYNSFVNRIAEQQLIAQMFDKLSNPILSNMLTAKGFEIDIVELVKDYLITFNKKTSMLKSIKSTQQQPLNLPSGPQTGTPGNALGQAGLPAPGAIPLLSEGKQA